MQRAIIGRTVRAASSSRDLESHAHNDSGERRLDKSEFPCLERNHVLVERQMARGICRHKLHTLQVQQPLQ